MIVFASPSVRKDRLHVIRHGVVDLRALERYILEALDVQRSERALQEHEEARQLIERMIALLHVHIERLDEHLHLLSDHSRGELPDLSRSVTGVFVGFVCKMRSHETSNMLRDDFTLLNLAAAGYSTLHATALALDHASTAELALIHLREVTPLIAEINRVLPAVVVSELSVNFPQLDPSVAERALASTHAAWSAGSRRSAGSRSLSSRSPFGGGK